MLDLGTICRSRETILKCADEDDGRLCRIVALVPEHRWRNAGIPEYKVELVAFPVTAFRREHELLLVPSADTSLWQEPLAAS